ncbi:MAG: hypothetical protein DWI00_15055 [Planctomycetota bacterium]|nr:MAG: hypothetical protein DWI00_15055 [Planctomycetota bacterium]
MSFPIHVPCRCIFWPFVLMLAALTFLNSSHADDPSASAASPEMKLVSKVIAAAGGDDKLLTLFRMEERYSAGKEFVPPGTARVSVVEPPKSWWIGTNERGTEPAKITAWAWTLGVLKDPKSKLELLPDITDNEKSLSGLRITESVDPAIDMYFDKETDGLVRVDWRNDIYRFSDWKDFDGTKYPAKCAMFRRNSGEPWFFHEIVTIERLQELPEGLQR